MSLPPRGLDAFFAPRGVAVVGASRQEGKVGHAVLQNLLYAGSEGDRSKGFQGQIVPVNPRAETILGLDVLSSVERLPEGIDLAVFAIPAEEVPVALDQAGRRGVRAAIVLSAGFFEMGSAGRKLGARLSRVAENTGVRLIGPNCMGIFAAASQLSASFYGAAPIPGHVTLISESGAVAQALLEQSRCEALGLRNVISLGARADVTEAELIRYFGRDEQSELIGVHLETLDDARAFHEATRDTCPKKPVVVLRGGSTGAGHRAAKRHEGSLSVRDRAIESALSYNGLHQVHSLPAFLAALRTLATQPPARGRRVAIVTNAGGAGVLAADAAARAGLDVINLRPETVAKLAGISQNPRSLANPVDLLGDATPARFLAAIEVIGAAREVDAILLVLTTQPMSDSAAVAAQVCEYASTLDKPLVASLVGAERHQHERLTERYGVPDFVFPETAVEGLRALVARGEYLRRLRRRRPVDKPHRRTRARSWS
ncbi:MAG: CoA-binding protein [Planctomycetes bacterium]|nr:CoA-binding protein [Planctomycetota bacterium]